MVWGGGGLALIDRFDAARHAWSTADHPSTYQGFVKAWRSVGLKLLYMVAGSLRRGLIEIAGEHALRFGFFVLAADGSRFALASTADHERVFGRGDKQRDKQRSTQRGKHNDKQRSKQAPSSPQMWITMLWQMGVGLPWDWRLGRGNASERHHLRKMLGATPANTLLVMDAGFTGYDLLRSIVDSGRHFLLRIGSHVELLRDLDYEIEQRDAQTVYLWPAHAQHARRSPLVLRLVKTRDAKDGRRKMYLLTSVRDATRLPDEGVVTLYRMRWGVELCYRALKQTLEARKLRSHASANALIEMQGLLLGLTLLGLMSVAALIRQGDDPLRWSPAAALRIVRRGIRHAHLACRWLDELGTAVKDTYVRCRQPRQRTARKKHPDPPPGRPRIRKPKKEENTLAAKIEEN